MLKRIWNRARKAQGAPRASSLRKAPLCETLESRQMLSGAPTDYVLSGYSWSNPSHITYSFPADGTPWDNGTNNLYASMASQFQNASWVRSIAKALQTWASVANINVVPVADDSEPFNTFGLSQGDPRFGDVRVGGYNFQSPTVLAQSYNPPPNGVTGAGDVEINTGFYWGPNAPYDLYSVMLHETGLALGLGETTAATAVMNRIYGGLRTQLDPVDVAGIQAIYGPRMPDPLQALGQATSVGSAFDVSTLLAPIGGGQARVAVGGLSLDAIGDTEYFSVVAPAGGGPETLTAVANPQGISSLSPAVIIYNAAMQSLAGASNPAAWSDGVMATAAGIVPGQRYIVAVTGATNDVFSVGAYNFQLTFKGVSSSDATVEPGAAPCLRLRLPVNPSPTTTPPAVPKDRFEPNNSAAQAVNLGSTTAMIVPNLTIYAAYDFQVFSFIAAKSGTVAVQTDSPALWAVDQSGRTIALGIGQISFANATAGARYWIVLGAVKGQANPGFSMAIAVVQTPPPHQQVIAPNPVAPARTPAIPAATPTPNLARFVADRPARPLQRVDMVNPRWMRFA